jgi:hypothetical protein
MLDYADIPSPCRIAIEMVASYGKPVGQEVFDTCVLIGRLWQHFKARRPALIFRKDVKMHLCGSIVHVNDGVIRQRLIDLWGGKEKAIGRKASPGPLYGIAKDEWQALALAVTFAETQGTNHDPR